MRRFGEFESFPCGGGEVGSMLVRTVGRGVHGHLPLDQAGRISLRQQARKGRVPRAVTTETSMTFLHGLPWTKRCGGGRDMNDPHNSWTTASIARVEPTRSQTKRQFATCLNKPDRPQNHEETRPSRQSYL